MAFGLSDGVVILLVGAAIFFFGRGKLMQWVKDARSMKWEWGKTEEQVRAEEAQKAIAPKA